MDQNDRADSALWAFDASASMAISPRAMEGFSDAEMGLMTFHVAPADETQGRDPGTTQMSGGTLK